MDTFPGPSRHASPLNQPFCSRLKEVSYRLAPEIARDCVSKLLVQHYLHQKLNVQASLFRRWLRWFTLTFDCAAIYHRASRHRLSESCTHLKNTAIAGITTVHGVCAYMKMPVNLDCWPVQDSPEFWRALCCNGCSQTAMNLMPTSGAYNNSSQPACFRHFWQFVVIGISSGNCC